MKKMGATWESAVVENTTPEQLPDTSFDIFKEQALKHKRISGADLNLSRRELLEKLQFLTEDGKTYPCGIPLVCKRSEQGCV